jgi:hypothetical protein
VYSLVVRNSGSEGLVADINCEPFSKFLLKHIKKDINNCQQLLGLVCMELAHHRQALNAILRGISNELLTDDEVQLMINFKNFIIKYTGQNGESWSFSQSLNRGFRAAKWMSKHFVLSIAIEVKQIDSLLAQKFGFQQQLIDVAENLYLNTLGRCSLGARSLFSSQLLKYHIGRETELKRERGRHDRAIADRSVARARGEDSDPSYRLDSSESSNSRFSTDEVVENNENVRIPEMISLLDDDDDEEVGIN